MWEQRCTPEVAAHISSTAGCHVVCWRSSRIAPATITLNTLSTCKLLLSCLRLSICCLWPVAAFANHSGGVCKSTRHGHHASHTRTSAGCRGVCPQCRTEPAINFNTFHFQNFAFVAHGAVAALAQCSCGVCSFLAISWLAMQPRHGRGEHQFGYVITYITSSSIGT